MLGVYFRSESGHTPLSLEVAPSGFLTVFRVVGVNARTGQISLSLSLSLLSSRRFQAVSVPQMGCLSSVVAFVPHLGVSVVEDSRQWGQASVSHLGLPSCPVWGCVVLWSSCAPVGVLRTGFPLSPSSLFCLVKDSRQYRCPRWGVSRRW